MRVVSSQSTYENRKGTELSPWILAIMIPSITQFLIGLSLIVSGLVNLFLFSMLGELILAISLMLFYIGWSTLSKELPVPRVPMGDVKPAWVRTIDIYAIFSLLDAVIMLLFFELARYSTYTQTLALYLMGIFLPISYLGSFIFRDALVSLLGRDFAYPINRPSTIIWVNSSLAKALLKLQRVRGVLYLRKSLVAAESIYLRAGRSTDSLDEAIDLLDLIWETGIQVDYDRMLSFANELFGSNPPKLDQLPNQCSRLVKSFDWFSQTRKAEHQGFGRNLGTILSKYGNTILGGAGLIGAAVAISQVFVNSLPAIGSTLQAQLPAIALVISALVILYIPARHLVTFLGVVVRLSDLKDYEEEYLGRGSRTAIAEKPQAGHDVFDELNGNKV